MRTASFLLLFTLPFLTSGLVAQKFVSTSGSDSNAGTQISPWRTLTFAAANSASGTIINIKAGTYGTTGFLEGIEVKAGKKLIFKGAGKGKTIVKANAGFAKTIPYFGTTRTWTAVFIIHGTGTDVRLQDMTIDANHLTASRLTTTIYSDGASGIVDHCALINAGGSPINGTQGQLGFMAVGKNNANPSTVRLTHCDITGFNKNGAMMFGEGLNGIVEHCLIQGAGTTGVTAQNGLQLGPKGKSFAVANNVIRDIWYGPSLWNAVGVLVYDSRCTSTITNNRILTCKTGFYHQNPTTGVSNFSANNVANCQWGVNAFTNGVTATNNFFDAEVSVYVANSFVMAMSGNSFSDFRTNVGYPTKYTADGNAGSQDNSPNKACLGLHLPVTVTQPTGSAPNSIATGDFNGDGKLDFAVANSAKNNVRVFFGSGGTNFTTIAAKTVTVPGGPSYLATGEFTGTVGTDLAVLTTAGKVYILVNDLGGSSGKFLLGSSFTFATPGGPSALAAGDIDGLFEDDLVVGFAGASVSANGGVRVLTVKAGVPSAGGAVPGTYRSVRGLALVKLNAGSEPDLLVVDASNLLGTSNKVHVLLNAAPFGSPTSYSIGASGHSVTAGDLDGDNDNDVVVTTNGNPGGVHVFANNGSGVLTQASSSPFRVAAGAEDVHILDLQDDSDFDHDRIDVAISHPAVHKVTRLRNYRNGGFDDFRGCFTGLDPQTIAFAKLDGDQLPDMLVVNRGDHDIAVSLADPDALAQSYGIGCKGTLDLVPEAFAAGTPPLPVVGNASFAISVRKGRGVSDTILILTVGETATLPACTVLPGLLFFAKVTQTDLLGNATIPMPVPNTPAAKGLDFYAQFGVLDANGGFLGLFALSQALRFRVGN